MGDLRTLKNRLVSIEVVYIFTIVIITITSFVLLHIAAKRNSSFSKNLVDARFLSQEGIKTIINAKNQNKPSIINDGHAYTWNQLLNGEITLPSCLNPYDLTIPCADFTLRECNESNSNSKYTCIEFNTKPHTDSSWKITENKSKMFSRKIRINDAEDKTKNITVFIWWIDSDGLHTSPLSYKLKHNQE